MNPINRRLNDLVEQRLERLEEEQQPVKGLSRVDVLNRIYDEWAFGIPANLPPPDPDTSKLLDEMCDRILASHERRNGEP
jgi:hypothetical protein